MLSFGRQAWCELKEVRSAGPWKLTNEDPGRAPYENDIAGPVSAHRGVPFCSFWVCVVCWLELKKSMSWPQHFGQAAALRVLGSLEAGLCCY